eukprot:412854_1
MNWIIHFCADINRLHCQNILRNSRWVLTISGNYLQRMYHIVLPIHMESPQSILLCSIRKTSPATNISTKYKIETTKYWWMAKSLREMIELYGDEYLSGFPCGWLSDLKEEDEVLWMEVDIVQQNIATDNRYKNNIE